VKRHGKTRQGKQRWYCTRCGKSFLWRLPRDTHFVRCFKWFRLWVQEGYSVRELSALSGRSPSSLRLIVRYWLSHAPPRQETEWRSRLRQSRHIIVDGTMLHRHHSQSVYAVMESSSHQLLYGSYGIREGARDLQPLYAMLAKSGLCPKSATTDGNPQQTRYLAVQWPSLRLQRCNVHVQRQGLRWCRRNPKRTDAKHLRKLFLALTTVKTSAQRNDFIRHVHQWDRRFGPAIRQARRVTGGWVFSDLALAAHMLVRSLPDLFHFIDDPHIASSTNALEGYFSRMKEKYRRHRGLAQKSRDHYFQWYFYLQPR